MPDQPSLFRQSSRQDQILERFERFNRENPIVWRLFVRFSLRAAAVRDRYSARALLHRVRWETDIELELDELGFKFNNDFTPYWSRMFVRRYPSHDGLFERRKCKSAERPAIDGERIVPRYDADDDPEILARLDRLAEYLEEES